MKMHPEILQHAYVKEGDPWPVPRNRGEMLVAGRREGTGIDVWWLELESIPAPPDPSWWERVKAWCNG